MGTDVRARPATEPRSEAGDRALHERLTALAAAAPASTAIVSSADLADPGRLVGTAVALVVPGRDPRVEEVGWFVRRLRRACPTLRVVVVGAVDDGSFTSGLAAGADAWVDRRATDAAVAAAIAGRPAGPPVPDRSGRRWRDRVLKARTTG